MAIAERKRAKITGRGKIPPFLMIPHWIIDTPEFAALKGTPLKLLVDLSRQYNGKNNGDLSPSTLRQRWRSHDTLLNAALALVVGGWIVKTRQGGLGMGPDLYAVTWWPMDACNGKHDYPAESVASHQWRKKALPENRAKPGPESGAGDQEKTANFTPTSPKTGPENAIFQAAAAPDFGHLYTSMP